MYYKCNMLKWQQQFVFLNCHTVHAVTQVARISEICSALFFQKCLRGLLISRHLQDRRVEYIVQTRERETVPIKQNRIVPHSVNKFPKSFDCVPSFRWAKCYQFGRNNIVPAIDIKIERIVLSQIQRVM